MCGCCANKQNCNNCAYAKKDSFNKANPNIANSIKIAFAGIPNCGKTTAYNYITGSTASTGNRPGVTVDIKAKFPRKSILQKALKNLKINIKPEEIVIIDIPGVYSLESYTPEERVASKYLEQNPPDVIINVIDATNMERGLFLTFQLLRMGIPVVIAMNMMDEAKRRGYKINMDELSKTLGVPVVNTIAYKGKGLDKALELALKAHETAINKKSGIRGDKHICDIQTLHKNIYSNQETIYGMISDVMNKCVKKGCGSRLSDFIDTILLNSWSGIPILFAIMIGVFWASFGPPGSIIADGFESLLTLTTNYIKNIIISFGLSNTMTNFINNGILDALTGVLVFIPQIILLFFFIAILEDIGLISRAAFLTDRFMRRFGLGGRSFIPMILGFGCTVPAILSTRTIPDKRDRIVTALSVPFISCGARLPVYGLLATAFFQAKAYIVIIGLYLLGIAATLVTSLLCKGSIMKGQTAPLIFELPPYRMPGFRNVRIRLMEIAWDFISRLLSVILLASIVMWVLQNFNLDFQITDNPETSIVAVIGKLIAPLFSPLGFGDWQRVSALIAGITAKETIIAAFQIIYGSGTIALLAFKTASALSFMVFVLLYVPCIASIATLYKELGKKRLVVLSLMWQLMVAWTCAFVAYQSSTALGW